MIRDTLTCRVPAGAAAAVSSTQLLVYTYTRVRAVPLLCIGIMRV